MKTVRRKIQKRSAALAVAATSLATAVAVAPGGLARASSARPTAAAATSTAICTAPTAHAALAAKLSRDIASTIYGRSGHIAIRVEDVKTGVECRYNEGSRSHSASVVKVTILAALLYWKKSPTSLTSKEKYEATLMIEQSDNAAATYLWNDVGHTRLNQFIAAATMTETELNSGGYWGLSLITARDELQQMRLLTEHNSVLSDSSRAYELYLMNHVVWWQRWGVPTGAPSGLTVYVKNGWLNDPVLWVINSIGAIEGYGRDYKMAILTYGNPGEQYGINTVNAIAKVANRDLNAGLPAAGTALTPATLPRSQQGQPDEVLPTGAH